MTQYVYLFHTREFFNSNQPIYKIGKTEQPNFTRFASYPKGSVMLFQSSCRNCLLLERKIIKLFTSKYEQKTSFGREYFEGDQFSMIGDLCDIVKNEEIDAIASNIIVVDLQSKAIEPLRGLDETIQDIIADETIQEVVVEEIIVEETILEEIMQEVIVSNIIVVDLQSKAIEPLRGLDETIEKPFGCVQCKYFCSRNANLQKHFASKKHLLNSEIAEKDIN
jgi:T5orf172 domain